MKICPMRSPQSFLLPLQIDSTQKVPNEQEGRYGQPGSVHTWFQPVETQAEHAEFEDFWDFLDGRRCATGELPS
jgi:hypothetical protein